MDFCIGWGMVRKGMKKPWDRIFIGTSGWSYSDWRGTFYPADLPQKGWLEFYSRQFSTVEINATFYHLPKLKTIHTWSHLAPTGFIFAIKGSRFITHIKKLVNLGNAMQTFSRRIQPMRKQTAVMLWQLPPSQKNDVPRLEKFLRRLPKGYRHAVEFRDVSWLKPETLETLRRHRVAFVSVSSPQMPMDLSVTADLVYIRFHGLETGAYHDYSRVELKPWAEHIWKQARAGNSVFVYFNNDHHAHAPKNALMLQSMLKGAL